MKNFEKHDIKLCHCFVVTLCDDGTESKQVLRSTILSSTILSFFFDNSRIGRFKALFSYMSLVEVRINRSKTGQHLTLINSNFDFLLFQVRLG